MRYGWMVLVLVALMTLGAAAYISINKHDDDSGHSDVGTYNTVAPVITDDSTTPAYDQTADQIIEEIAEEEGISLEADTPSETEEPTNPPLDPRIDRNGDGIQDVWYSSGADHELNAEDRNFDGKVDHRYISQIGFTDVLDQDEIQHVLDMNGIGDLTKLYPGLTQISMEQWDDDFDGTMDRVVMTYYYSGGEDRKEFNYCDDCNWASYPFAMLHADEYPQFKKLLRE